MTTERVQTSRARGVGWLVLLIVVIIVLVLIVGPPITRALDSVARAEYQQRMSLQQRQNAEMAPLWLWVKRALAFALIVGALSAAVCAVGFTVHGIRWVRNRAYQSHARQGLYAALFEEEDHSFLDRLPLLGRPHIRMQPLANEERAQVMAAFVQGNLDRLPAGSVKALLNPATPADGLLPGAAALPELLPADVIRPDPRNNPDTLVVGQKGSGKTNVLRYLINAYHRAMPGAAFLVLSPLSSNWPDIETVSRPMEVFETVVALREEMDRRDAAMKAQGIADFHRWSGAPGLVVVIVDEAEATADDLRVEAGANMAKEFGQRLRGIVNMGRNTGFLFVVGTQTARADVLDPAFMRNASRLLMLRMDAATAARFAVYGRDILTALVTQAIGRAYCPQAGGYVDFPLIDDLPDLRMYQSHLRLPADAEADGLGPADQPDGPASVPVPVPVPNIKVWPGLDPPMPGTGLVPGKLSLPAGLPDDAMIEAIWQAWRRHGRNINRAEQAVFELAPNSHGGHPWMVCAYALNKKLGEERYGKRSDEYRAWLARQNSRAA
jgi:hypothetical protein